MTGTVLTALHYIMHHVYTGISGQQTFGEILKMVTTRRCLFYREMLHHNKEAGLQVGARALVGGNCLLQLLGLCQGLLHAMAMCAGGPAGAGMGLGVHHLAVVMTRNLVQQALVGQAATSPSGTSQA